MSFDESLFQAVFRFANKNPLLDALGAFLADGVLYLFILVGVVFVLFQKNWRIRVFVFLEFILTMILARGIIAQLIQFSYSKLRPFEFYGFEPLVSSSGNAFPSGHATALFSIAMVFFFFSRRWGSWFLILALISGLARVYSGVHWPLDILGGLVIGVGSAVFIHFLLKDYRLKVLGP